MTRPAEMILAGFFLCAGHDVNLVPFHNQAGTDGMRVDDLDEWCRTHQDELIASRTDESYQLQPVKGVQIPGPGGGVS